MAIRTISATGGNWNSTTTWEEGVVPVANDDIFGVTASGNLVVNVATADMKSWDLTHYTGTISGSGRCNFVNGGTNSAGVSWNVEPNVILGGTWNQTGGFGKDGNTGFGIMMGPTFVTQSTSFSLLLFNSNGTVKLYSDLYAVNVSNGDIQTPTFDFGATFSLYLSGSIVGRGMKPSATRDIVNLPQVYMVGDNQPGSPSPTFSTAGIQTLNSGLGVHYISGTFAASLRGGIPTSMTNASTFFDFTSYTVPIGLGLSRKTGGGAPTIADTYVKFGPNVRFLTKDTAFGDNTEFTIVVSRWGSSTTVPYYIENQSGQVIPRIIVDDLTTSVTNATIGPRIIHATGSQLEVDTVQHIHLTQQGLFQSGSTFSGSVVWQGMGLSCSNYITNPQAGYITNFRSTLFSSAGEVRFGAGVTHSIGRLILMNNDRVDTIRGAATTQTPLLPIVSSATASKATVEIREWGFVHNYDVSNIDFIDKTISAVGKSTINDTTGATTSFGTSVLTRGEVSNVFIQ